MNTRNIILITCLIVFGCLFSCDTPGSLEEFHNQVFIKLYGGIESEEAYDFVQLEDGGYVIVGSTTSYGEGDSDVFLVRTDENGVELWSRSYGDSLYNEIGKSVIIGEDNNSIIVCGERRSAISPQNSSDILLVKTDLEGNELALNTVGDANRDERGQQVIHAISDGYAVLGNVAGAEADTSLFLFEVDNNLIQKPGIGSDNYGIQGAIQNEGRNVFIHDDLYLCFGTVQELADSSANFFLYHIDINSTSITTVRQFGGSADDVAVDMTEVGGGYLLSGYQINGNKHIPYFIKLRSNFANANAELWRRRIEYSGSTEPRSIIESNDGGYMVLQRSLISPFGNEFQLLKLNFDGSEAWNNYFGSQNNDLEDGGNIIQLSNDFFVICGTIRFDEKNNEDVYKMSLMKVNPQGNLEPLSN